MSCVFHCRGCSNPKDWHYSEASKAAGIAWMVGTFGFGSSTAWIFIAAVCLHTGTRMRNLCFRGTRISLVYIHMMCWMTGCTVTSSWGFALFYDRSFVGVVLSMTSTFRVMLILYALFSLYKVFVVVVLFVVVACCPVFRSRSNRVLHVHVFRLQSRGVIESMHKNMDIKSESDDESSGRDTTLNDIERKIIGIRNLQRFLTYYTLCNVPNIIGYHVAPFSNSFVFVMLAYCLYCLNGLLNVLVLVASKVTFFRNTFLLL